MRKDKQYIDEFFENKNYPTPNVPVGEAWFAMQQMLTAEMPKQTEKSKYSNYLKKNKWLLVFLLLSMLLPLIIYITNHTGQANITKPITTNKAKGLESSNTNNHLPIKDKKKSDLSTNEITKKTNGFVKKDTLESAKNTTELIYSKKNTLNISSQKKLDLNRQLLSNIAKKVSPKKSKATIVNTLKVRIKKINKKATSLMDSIIFLPLDKSKRTRNNKANTRSDFYKNKNIAKDNVVIFNTANTKKTISEKETEVIIETESHPTKTSLSTIKSMSLSKTAKKNTPKQNPKQQYLAPQNTTSYNRVRDTNVYPFSLQKPSNYGKQSAYYHPKTLDDYLANDFGSKNEKNEVITYLSTVVSKDERHHFMQASIERLQKTTRLSIDSIYMSLQLLKYLDSLSINSLMNCIKDKRQLKRKAFSNRNINYGLQVFLHLPINTGNYYEIAANGGNQLLQSLVPSVWVAYRIKQQQSIQFTIEPLNTNAINNSILAITRSRLSQQDTTTVTKNYSIIKTSGLGLSMAYHYQIGKNWDIGLGTSLTLPTKALIQKQAFVQFNRTNFLLYDSLKTIKSSADEWKYINNKILSVTLSIGYRNRQFCIGSKFNQPLTPIGSPNATERFMPLNGQAFVKWTIRR